MLLPTATCPNCSHSFPCGLGPDHSGALVTLTLPPASPCHVTLQLDPHRRVKITYSPSPEPSPSDQVAFVIPSPPAPATLLAPLKSDGDLELEQLAATVQALQTSGWYHEGLSWQESATLLQPTSPGTFLVRASSDPRYLFALSVQTERGPTSVRLHYRDGSFRLDAAPKLVPAMPLFRCVLRLVEYYVAATGDRKARGLTGKEQVWVDCSGRTYSSILLSRPLHRKDRFPSLQHLARLTLQRHALRPPPDLPECLHRYLAEYPYCL